MGYNIAIDGPDMKTRTVRWFLRFWFWRAAPQEGYLHPERWTF